MRFSGSGDFVRKVVRRAQHYLAGPGAADILACVGLLDLYGASIFPDTVTSIQDRIEWGSRHFESQVGDSRFRMFFAVHELEAWLLADPSVFPPAVSAALPAAASAQPESVNFRRPPAKLMDEIYTRTTGRAYKKVTYGKRLFAGVDVHTARDKCPALTTLLDAMKGIAVSAGL